MLTSLIAALMLTAAPVQTPGQDADAPIVTGANARETADALRLREALAYSNPLPRGAPEQDYPLVAWCDALVSGHVRLGESLLDFARVRPPHSEPHGIRALVDEASTLVRLDRDARDEFLGAGGVV